MKQQTSSKSDTPHTPTPPPAIPTATTREHNKRTTKPKIAVVGDSNARNLYKHIDHTVTDNAVWVSVGCKLEDVKSRARDMLTSSYISVIHLGMNDALSSKSDNDYLSDVSDAIDCILDNTENTIRIVCSVPPTRSKTGQRRVRMINTLLKYKCEMNNVLKLFA